MRTGQILLLSGLLGFVALSGCGQHCGLTDASLLPPCCDTASLVQCGRPGHLADAPDPHNGGVASIPAVSTVLNPEASKREISLQECIALALEKGRVGGTSIRVLAYDPAVAYTQIEEGLSRFDARFLTSMLWSKIDEPQSNVLSNVGFGAAQLAAGILNQVGDPNEIDGAAFLSRIEKPLPTGGLTGITFLTDYTLVNSPPVGPGVPNPSYRTRLIFNVEQPLLRGFGTTVNQAPIVIARLTFDQERERFYGNVNQLLFAVEAAYWDLYFSYWNLHTIDLALRQAHTAWEFADARFKAKVAGTAQDVAALELQYQGLRLARLDALGGQGRSVLEAERQLRFVVGLPPEDGCRLIPIDQPTAAPYCPDWQAALTAALNNRPELIQLRQEVKKIEVDLKRLRNQTLPDLRVAASYDINGLGSRLDGQPPDNALRSLASNHFNNWTVGLTLDVPIGFRAANSQLRRGQLQMAQRMVQLRDQEKQATFGLQAAYRDLVRAAEAVRIQKTITATATRRFQLDYKAFTAEGAAPNTLSLLTAQQNWTAALAAERATIFTYNIALAKFELEKGTIQEYDNVSISDGPLPKCVQDRASAHINARKRACVLRERPADHCSSGPHCGPNGCSALIPGPNEAPPALATLQIDTTQGANAGPAANTGQWQATATETLPALKVRTP